MLGLCTATLLLLGLTLTGCDQAERSPPPPLVDVMPVESKPVPNVIDLPGRIEAVRSAEVRARTDGIVQRRLYDEGTDVPAGAPLFLIDSRDKLAQLEQARAMLARATAERDNASEILARYRPLVREKAVSALENDRARADWRQAEANVLDARAALSRAELQLGYATVRAPITGRVGRAQVTEGALVSATNATLLTTIDQLDPVHATFTHSNAELQTLMDQARRGELSTQPLRSIEVRLTLANDAAYDVVGHLDFADLSVDPSTGSQTLRATFANPGHVLLPGQFVRGRILAGIFPAGVTIPQRAIHMVNGQASVTLVDAKGIVSVRMVELGAQLEDAWIVRSGLRRGDQIVVAGWQKVRNGDQVRIRALSATRRGVR
ncbi:efflux RND transporter periplasmic adaptor subunit [Sphingobium sp. TKS]|uniref:efflux RND transporter periplasmic adaptor subunit n=1 Tax=Sphingobium sp. TKS TaxID=1315974 RepID=UPI0011A0644B|nr:efflux RND transporter periplasmic adaptor subunit [Sphingobium sp. TKS]